MNTLQQILNMIRRILGLSTSMRSTITGLKREAGQYKTHRKAKDNNIQTTQSGN